MLKRILKTWVLTSFVIFVACSAAYLTGQQVLRQSANDPQVQMAEDIVNAMARRTYQPGPKNLNPIEISTSLSPFTIVYDDKGSVISSDGVLGNDVPSLPRGVMDWVRNRGQDKITWEPDGMTRIAAVVMWFNDSQTSGFVVVGRNLAEVESRIRTLTMQFAMGFIIAEVGALVLIVGLEVIFKDKRK